jgi:excisionase family DNA binding protein
MKTDKKEKLLSEGVVTISEASRISGLGRTYLYTLMDRGELGYCKVGKRRLIPRAEITRLLASNWVGR